MSAARSQMFTRKAAAALVGMVIGAVTFVFVQQSVAGPTFTVNSTADFPDIAGGDGLCAASVPRPNGNGNACTLRAAIMQANASDNNATIQVPTGNYNLQQDGDDDDASDGDLDILQGMTINGAGSETTIVNGAGMQQCEHQRVFSNLADFGESVTFNGLTIEEGSATLGGFGCDKRFRAGRAAGVITQFGGGIYNEGNLFLTDVLVQHNEAGQAGGGIYSAGALTITDSEIHNNIVGACPVQNGNRSSARPAGFGNNHIGGGIAVFGGMTMTDSLVIENEVIGRQPGGGGGPFRPAGEAVGAQGGGVYQGKAASMTESDVIDNHAFLQNCNPQERRERTAGIPSSDLAQGGGIYNAGSLELTDVLVGDPSPNEGESLGNTAGRGGGILNSGGSLPQRPSGPPSFGLTMDDTQVLGNLAGVTGGGIDNEGTMDAQTSEIYGNLVGLFLFVKGNGNSRPSGILPSAAGGGLYNGFGYALIRDNTLVGDPDPGGNDFLGNVALRGGGIYNDFNGLTDVEGSHVDGNSAGQGGGIWNVGEVNVTDDSTVSFNLAGPFIFQEADASARPAGVPHRGGGIFNELNQTKCRGTGGCRASGGENFTVTVEESTLEGNRAESGGGLFNRDEMLLNKSTVDHNTAQFTEQQAAGARPQGKFSDGTGGGLTNLGFFIAQNSTFSANTADVDGAGLYTPFNGFVGLTHVTIADNELLQQPERPSTTRGAGSPGGGLVDHSGNTSEYMATLFSNNNPTNCSGGGLVSNGDNVSDDGSCPLDGGNDEQTGDALLGGLTDNGGPTLTHMPSSGSPAVDHIPGKCRLIDDQRSVERPIGDGCEAGSVELGGEIGPSPSPSPPTPPPPGSPPPTPSPSPSLTECPGFEGDPRNDVIGTSGEDVLDGTPEDDIICAFESDDILRGFEGNDLLLAGPDHDRSFAGPGDDRVRSSTGSDQAFGNDGEDEIRGGRGNDFLQGNDGDDVVRGYENNDVVRGGDGNDQVLGFPGDDEVNGEDGNDFVKGGLGDDDLDGGANNDDCNGGQGQDTVQNCESGSPRVQARRVADRRSGF